MKRVAGVATVIVNETENLIGVRIKEEVSYYCLDKIASAVSLISPKRLAGSVHTHVADDQDWPSVLDQRSGIYSATDQNRSGNLLCTPPILPRANWHNKLET